MLVKRIGILSAGTIAGILHAGIGLLFGAFISLAALLGSLSGYGSSELLLGAGAALFLPVLYGAFGFLSGALMAWLFNLAASLNGGLQLEVEHS